MTLDDLERPFGLRTLLHNKRVFFALNVFVINRNNKFKINLFHLVKIYTSFVHRRT